MIPKMNASLDNDNDIFFMQYPLTIYFHFIDKRKKLHNGNHVCTFKHMNKLARWPLQLPTTKDMQMQMIHRLRTVFSIVDN